MTMRTRRYLCCIPWLIVDVALLAAVVGAWR